MKNSLRDAGSGFTVFETDLAVVGMTWTPGGICDVQIGHRDTDATRDALSAEHPDLPEVRRLPVGVRAIRDRIRAHLKGKNDPMRDIPVDLSRCSEFSRTVLQQLRKVPPGKTVTYGELAARCGRPGAARAVGRIMGANPVPVIVPCHRCVGGNGALTGFSAAGGTVLKARMLYREGAVLRPEYEPGLSHLKKVDPKMRKILGVVGPYLAVPDRPGPPYDTLVTAIVHQQLSVKAGQTIAGRVRDLTEGPHYPTPAEILALPPAQIRECGLSNAKVGFVRDLAERVEDGRLDLRSLRRMGDDEVIETLTAVKGIGVWSAHMHLIFHLGRLDVLPTGDLGLRMAAAKLYGLDEYATPAQLTEIAEPWRPYRSMGSWYLWRALDTGGI